MGMLGLLLFTPSHASELSIIGHGFSKHLENHNFNERAYGAGLRYDNESYGIQAGSYHNSLRKNSTYAGLDWSPIHSNITGCLNYQIGLFIGGATGYKYSVTPLSGAQASLRCKNAFVRVRVMPDIYYNSKFVGAVEFGYVIAKF